MVLEQRFRLVNGHPLRKFGFDPSSGEFRCKGQWLETNPLEMDDISRLQSLGIMLHCMPGWPLADGLDHTQFIPDSHQLLVSDTLATTWLSQTGLRRIPRTRVLVADEGGTGKTLGVAVAIRWIVTQPEANGPVIILVPPLLKEHWARHLRAVFNDDPDRVRILRSARFFNWHQHKDDIIIVSKFSWIHHWNSVQESLRQRAPLCVVIDEAHQGRSGMADRDPEELEDADEGNYEPQGVILEEGEGRHIPQHHADVLLKTCSRAEFAIGVTATPINIQTVEIEWILRILGAEQMYNFDPALNEDWNTAVSEISNWAREANPTEFCPNALLKAISLMIRNGQFPPQWNELNNDDLQCLTDWFGNADLKIRPDQALRLTRELHPYGRHLSMTLRRDLKRTREGETLRFRTRNETSCRVDCNEEMLQFLGSVQRNNHHIGMNETLRTSTRIVCSHRLNPRSTYQGAYRYPGEWTFNPDLLTWDHIRSITDPRIPRLRELIRYDLNLQTNADVVRQQRGCVIFTEFKGTIDGLMNDIRQNLPDVDGVHIDVQYLSGDVDLNQARQVLNRCERMSLRHNRFPVLICTPAGEVGLDMEWATTLIHWDLNTNPQRLEQRTWRLDRRISNDATTAEYRVIHMLLNEIPSMVRIENRVNDNFNRAATALGLNNRTYIPVGDMIGEPILPGGSNHHTYLIDDEIRRFDHLLHEGNEEVRHWQGGDSWPGLRLKEAERLRTATFFHFTGLQNEPTQILNQGFTGNFDGWNEQLEINQARSNLIRDIEEIASPISQVIGPIIPRRRGQHSFLCAWDSDDSQSSIPLPSAKLALPGLFGPITRNWQSKILVPVIRLGDVQKSEHKSRLVVAINLDIANLHTNKSAGLDDRGMRIIGDLHDGEFANVNEQDGWALINQCIGSLLSNSCEDFDAIWESESVLDPRGAQIANDRIQVLRRRNREARDIIAALSNQIEEDNEDDQANEGRRNRIGVLEESFSARESLINTLCEMSHQLTPVAILEVL